MQTERQVRHKSMNNDLTKGRPGLTLLKFSIPMLLSSAFQQLYNIADSAIAGKFAGEEALASVGTSYPLTMIFFAIASGFAIGCNVIISQLFGAKFMTDVKTAIKTSIASSVALSVIFTALGFVFSGPLLRLLQTPQKIFADSLLYLLIYVGGLLFLFLYNACTGVFTALGDSKTPLVFLIASSVGNIVLDYIFVAWFHLGVAGVAWATFIAQGIASLLVLIVLVKRYKTLDGEPEKGLFSLAMFFRIARIALPSILQQSFVSVGNLFVQGIINSFGTAAIAAYSSCMKLNLFAVSFVSTISNALSSYTGQNIGAGNLKRVKSAYKVGILITWALVLPFFVFYTFFAPSAIHVFLDPSASGEAIQIGARFLQIVSPFYFVIAIKIVFDGVLRGAGAMIMFLISTFSDLIVRVLLAYVLADALGIDGLGYAWVCGWCVASILTIIFYFSGRWYKLTKG